LRAEADSVQRRAHLRGQMLLRASQSFTDTSTVPDVRARIDELVLSGLAAAAQSAHPGAADARPLSTTVEFLRPVQVTDRLRARTVAIRDGRRFRTLGTELLLPDGRTAVRAVGTALRR
ncbi:hotdog fold domain-containing protein, partial [Pseudonocardia sp. McavD-2-B]|uniref:hotdog fold domain-containing protein n=1 Tax=Pseudonocardia sp. McavD-2-B TaxID=2954499 RepID=UPI00209827C0